MSDKMDHDHDHEQDSFEPLKQEFYEGKHLTAPVKEIQVRATAKLGTHGHVFTSSIQIG